MSKRNDLHHYPVAMEQDPAVRKAPRDRRDADEHAERGFATTLGDLQRLGP